MSRNNVPGTSRGNDFPLRDAICLILLPLFFLTFGTTRSAASEKAERHEEPDYSRLNIEELMNLDITSVSKRKQKFSDAAAAAFVITGEDIRRSGATALPELLRMVPGLQVARIDNNKWAVTARGFNGRLSNKLLVLMDGRSVYSPISSGVFWSMQDTILSDIDRIEVIRGPGATLWGANAVNGVINIITKSARMTQGGFVSLGAGDEERGFGSARMGGMLSDHTAFRVYAKYFDRDDSRISETGKGNDDGWVGKRVGFRLDGDTFDSDTFTLQGDLYEGRAGEIFYAPVLTPPYMASSEESVDSFNGNILGRWNHVFSNLSEMSLQFYYDHNEYDIEALGTTADTFDLDLTHRFNWGGNHETVWGIGYRNIHDKLRYSFALTFEEGGRTTETFSAFIQDDMGFMNGRFHLILGSKLEHNDFTGFELQPSVRASWNPAENTTIWASISRAVRVPLRGEEGVRFNLYVMPIPEGTLAPGSPEVPALASAFGNPDPDAEELTAYELGFRTPLMDDLFLDIACFYNDYENLRDYVSAPSYWETSPEGALLVYPYNLVFDMKGYTWGAELALQWDLLEWWRLFLSYGYLEVHLDPREADSPEAYVRDPSNQFSVRSRMNPAKNVELDINLRYVDDLPDEDVSGYTELDLRIGWKPRENVEISLVGRNLLNDAHGEFVSEYIDIAASEIERSFYGMVKCTF